MKIKVYFISFVLLSLSIWLNYTQAHGSKEQHEKEVAARNTIRTLGEQYKAAITAKDLKKTINFYTPDALLMLPRQYQIAGKDKIKTIWENRFTDKHRFEYKLGRIEVTPDQEMAYEVGEITRLTTHIAHRSKKSEKPAKPKTIITARGKYIIIWKKFQDQWKVVVDMSTDGLPPK